ncbi:hypothetical protein PGQ11_010656 [Apiospora arundinis]|uniref:Zn(2)-C6 fungal-type domain-containing protein n=1 Tax=Apiospora arundinis TaxID=335852 RepID=A0ABR2IA97_9PEZI
MEMEDVSLQVAEKDTAAEIAAEAAVSDPANHRPPPPPKPSDAANPRKTCQPCRLRKVRCLQGDGASCANCDRLGFTCSFQAGSPQGDGDNGSASSMTLPRRRVRLACSNCHSRKARCSGEMPKCKRCQSQGIECIYRPTKRSGSLTTPAPGQAGDSEHESISSEPPEKRRHVHDDANPSQRDYSVGNRASAHGPWPMNHESRIEFPDEALITRTFDNYFKHVHHVPVFSFLHRASLMQRYHAGMMDRALLLALVGITSLLTDLGPGTREYGAKCIDECQKLILGDMENPSTIKIQAMVFIMKYRMLTQRFTSAFMLASVAGRSSYALRLNYENPNLCFLARESRRRLMWAFMTIDSGINGGYPDFTLLPSEALHIQLPCNERNFEFDLPQITEHLRPIPTKPFPDDVGSLALHVRLLWIRSRILYCTKNVLAMPEAELRELPKLVDVLAQELNGFNEHLPASFRFSDNNVKLRAYSPRLCVFIMIHVWWRQCHCDLYRIALVGLKEALPRSSLDRLPPGFVEMCQRQCYEHALAMAEIFRVVLSLDGGLPVTDLDLPVCAYQCARMLFFAHHMAGMQFQISADQVHEHSQRCLQIARHMSHIPAVQTILTDLEKLISRGFSTSTTPSHPGSPDFTRASIPTQQILSRHNPVQLMGITDENEIPARVATNMVASPAIHGAIASPLTHHGVGTPILQTPLSQSTPPATAARAAAFADQVPGQHHVGMARPHLAPVDPPEGLDNNNAFEGAMDGFDFNMESFGNTGAEAVSWFSNEWLGNEYSQTTA